MGVPINCEGCVYHRPISQTYGGSDKVCHFMLDTGRRRGRKGDICLSRSETKKVKIHKFDIPASQM